MSINVNEAMELPSFEYFSLLCGRGGLSNKITKTGILDYELNEVIEKNFTKGEFVITTLLVLKDDIGGIKDMVKQLIKVGASGLAIKNVYFDDIPQKVKNLCDEMDFPVFIFHTVFFEEIMDDITKAIRLKDDVGELKIIIDNVLNDDVNPIRARKYILGINGSFLEKNICAYIKSKNGRIYEEIRAKLESVGPWIKNSRVIPYREGTLLVFTFEAQGDQAVKDKVTNAIDYLCAGYKVNIGIGEVHENLEEIRDSISEAMHALRCSVSYSRRLVFFEDMGIDKILIPLIDNKWVLNYYKENIIALIDYDRRNKTHLMETSCAYIENKGDIKKTAGELFQHQNTIRYRIDKARSVIGGKSKAAYEDLALSVRLYKIMEGNL